MVKSQTDVRTFMPFDVDGMSYSSIGMINLPSDIGAGDYRIDVAILAHPNAADPDVPEIDLAIEGRLDDGWYEVASLQVIN